MPHETALLATVAAGLGLAFAFGLLASRLRLPPILGYLLAGVAVGPFTPGYVADQGLATQLAEIGVILLMFGVGLHFSIADLRAVRRIAVPGALTGALLAEWLATGKGIGYAVVSAAGRSQNARVWALVVVVTVTALVLYLLAQLVEAAVLSRFGRAEGAR